MLFNSLEFLIFFPVVTVLYFVLPHRFRWLLLLVASCIFYMAYIPAFLLILIGLIILDYFMAIRIEDSDGKIRKMYLLISILSMCGVLFIFKYFNFFNENLAHLAHALHLNYPTQTLQILLPIGLSFHTFQSLSYVIEVYRKNQKAERHFGIYALYVMFYPQLVAGPIERPQNLLHQFHTPHDFEYRRVTDGLKLMAWGFFKKIAIANKLSIFVNQVYANPQQYDGVSLTVATIFFAFQIYCDFSGYSDVAIGAAQVMGIKLMDNFNRPYFSKTTAEFWKRWHISLSTWFKDYVYIPLGGNKGSAIERYRNLLITFLISGLWHGANWTYIIWGLLNGLYVIMGQATANLRNKCKNIIGLDNLGVFSKYLRILITFTLICLAWIFFRAQNLNDAIYILTHLCSRSPALTLTSQTKLDLLVSAALIAVLLIFHAIQRHGHIRHMLSDKPAWLRWSAYYAIVSAIILSIIFDQSYKEPFIYFKF